MGLGHANYLLAAALLLLGLHGLVTRPNLVRKLMAMSVLQVAVIMFFLSLAAKDRAHPPIVLDGPVVRARDYINPLPHALMLTAIVVSVSTTGVALALLIRIHRRYGTLEEPELLERLRE